jgi:hypothetical protein
VTQRFPFYNEDDRKDNPDMPFADAPGGIAAWAPGVSGMSGPPPARPTVGEE